MDNNFDEGSRGIQSSTSPLQGLLNDGQHGNTRNATQGVRMSGGPIEKRNEEIRFAFACLLAPSSPAVLILLIGVPMLVFSGAGLQLLMLGFVVALVAGYLAFGLIGFPLLLAIKRSSLYRAPIVLAGGVVVGMCAFAATRWLITTLNGGSSSEIGPTDFAFGAVFGLIVTLTFVTTARLPWGTATR